MAFGLKSMRRRHVLAGAMGAIGALDFRSPRAAATVSGSAAQARGRLCVLSHSSFRFPLAASAATFPSVIVVVDLVGGGVQLVPSSVVNLHDLVVTQVKSRIYALGHESPEKVELFNWDFTERKELVFPGVTFRGHGIPYGEGVLLAAEASADPSHGGFLLYLDDAGAELGRFASGGERPHEIVDVGSHFAVAHYGDVRRDVSAKPSFPRPHFQVENAGVSFITKQSMSVSEFVPLDNRGAATHLAPAAEGTVFAMQMQDTQYRSIAQAPVGVGPQRAAAERDGVVLLPIEEQWGNYEEPLPLTRLSHSGVQETYAGPSSGMRRAQSFARGRDGTVVATHAASHSLWIHQDGHQRFVNTLAFGVSDPRGCAFIGDTSLVAVSGNEYNIAIWDARHDKLVNLIGTPLGRHSHARWQPKNAQAK